jgi:hypothetical protein
MQLYISRIRCAESNPVHAFATAGRCDVEWAGEGEAAAAALPKGPTGTGATGAEWNTAIHIGVPREIKVREYRVGVVPPQPAEREMLREGQILFTYLNLAPDAAQARDLIASRATCVAYETVTGTHGALPLLAPMSEVAGRPSKVVIVVPSNAIAPPPTL